MYESCTVHNDMNILRTMPKWQRIFMLLWLAGPSIYMAISTFSMFLSVVFACFSSEYVIVKVIAALAAFFFLLSGLFTLSVTILFDKRYTSAAEEYRESLLQVDPGRCRG